MSKEMYSVCRYYRGEESKAPEDGSAYLWSIEQSWCQLQETEQGKDELGSVLDEYLAYGLIDFENMDGVPITLKAILFNRFAHWNRPNIDEFKNWYLETYRK